MITNCRWDTPADASAVMVANQLLSSAMHNVTDWPVHSLMSSSFRYYCGGFAMNPGRWRRSPLHPCQQLLVELHAVMFVRSIFTVLLGFFRAKHFSAILLLVFVIGIYLTLINK